MSRVRVRFFSLLSFFLFLSLTRFCSLLFADFQLLDAIQQFGEKRYVTPVPPRLKAGPVRVHPYLKSKVEYDDNILLEDRDRREDVIFNITPGAILELPINKHQLAVGYEADMEFFTKNRHHDQNHGDHNFFALADLQFPSWYINILENLRETSSRSGTTFTDRIPRIEQSIYPKIGYRWRRAVFETGFRHVYRNFRHEADEAFDFNIYEWTDAIYYDLFARLKALVEYQIAKIEYNNNHSRDGIYQQARIGLEGEVMPNVTVKTRTGFHFRNFNHESRNDFYWWVFDASVRYQMRPNLKFELSFEREPIEATFNDVPFYKRHIFRFLTEYQILPKWVLFGESKYYRDRYSERATVGSVTAFRRDQHVGLKTGIRYLLQEWWEIETAYEYLHRISNFSTFDYTDNRFTLSTSLRY